jgi:hypothetical protein
MLLSFSATLNQDTQEAVFIGNITTRVAMAILQNIIINDEIKKAQEVKDVKPNNEPTASVGQQSPVPKG